MSIICLLLVFSTLFRVVRSQLDFYNNNGQFSAVCVQSCNGEEISSLERSCKGVFQQSCLVGGESHRKDCIGNFNSSVFKINGEKFLRSYCDSFYQDISESVNEHTGETVREISTCTGTYEWINGMSWDERVQFLTQNKTCIGAHLLTRKTGPGEINPTLDIVNAGMLMLKDQSQLATTFPPSGLICRFTCNDDPLDGSLCIGDFLGACDFDQGGDQQQFLFTCSGVNIGGGWKGSTCLGFGKHVLTAGQFVNTDTCSRAWIDSVHTQSDYQIACEGVYQHY